MNAKIHHLPVGRNNPRVGRVPARRHSSGSYSGQHPVALQKQHWHRLGSLSRCMFLLDWHLDNNKCIPTTVRQRIEEAMRQLHLAMRAETANNEFINPRRKKK